MGDRAEIGTQWLTVVLEFAGERLPLVGLQPADDAAHDQVRRRLSKAGFARVSKSEWARLALPWSATTAVDVAEGKLIRFTNGTTSFYCDGALEVGPMMMQAGVDRGRVAVALLPPDWVSEATGADGLAERVGQAAAERKLWAATGAFRVDLVKLTGPEWRQPR